MGLVLDSSVVIAVERRGDTVLQLLTQIREATGDQQAVLSAIGLTELVHGIYRAKVLQTRERRRSFILELIDALEVRPYTRGTAMLAGRIDGEQRNLGVVISFADLLIAATALNAGYSVLTTNSRHFQLIPDLSVVRF